MSVSIDLVICTFNNAALLDRVLQAIAEQQIAPQVDWGVLVVDNNCTDHTSAVVEAHQRSGKIPDLRVVKEPQQGLNHARLCGVQQTKREWLAFVDDDCILQKDWVDQAVRFATEHPNCGAFGGQVILEWEVPPPDYILKYGYCFARQEYGNAPRLMNCLVGAGMVIKRSALLQVGWMEQQFTRDRVGHKLISGGDVELALRIGSQFELWYNPTCQLHHVIPARRTATNYLLKLNYGLGISQIYGDSMLWSASYAQWFWLSSYQTLKASGRMLLDWAKVALQRRTAADVAIASSFVLGRWTGILRLLFTSAQTRQALLGCARIAPHIAALHQQAKIESAAWQIYHLELSEGVPNLNLESQYQGMYLVLWWQNIPLGNLELIAAQFPLPASQLINLILPVIAPTVGSYLLEYGFRESLPVVSDNPARDRSPDFDQVMALERPLTQFQAQLKLSTKDLSVSVVVCTRDRPDQLEQCLRSLQLLSTKPEQIIVVDNAPSCDRTRQLVATMPEVTYVLEPQPGLSAARNAGIRACTGDIVAFTDDDVRVHPDWIARLQQGFYQPQVMAVTGLMLPAELKTEAQLIFHQGGGGPGWGYRRLTFDQQFFTEMQSKGVPVWRIGAGANMAFRRQVFDLVGNFEERLGAGTAGCSEDSELWYRILAAGWLCSYEPSATIYHYHRKDMQGLRHQMYHYLRGHVAALLIQFEKYQHWGNLRRLGLTLPRYYLQRLLKYHRQGWQPGKQTLWAEIVGYWDGLKFYWQHRERSSKA